jgi:hypothetical protein
MLSHIVYVSVRKPECSEEEIQKILTACQNNNGKIDVTGVLLYSDTQFVQYLEGDYKQIIGLYDKIKTDDRHRNAVLISSSPISERSFPTWQMGSRRFSADRIAYKTDISKSEEQIFNRILSGNASDTKAITIIRKFFK